MTRRTIGVMAKTAADGREAAQLLARRGAEVVSGAELATADVVLVLGGDGTLLRAANRLRDTAIPIIAVNFGHVGFLAEAEPESLADVIDKLVAGNYRVEERLALDICVTTATGKVTRGWALNELAVEKAARGKMVDLAMAVDAQPVSSYSCDAMVISTPTGSTAYAFSGGGPVVWPDVEAILIVPIAAHALFSRPLVVAPDSLIELRVTPGTSDAEIWLDGSRSLPAPIGSTISIRRAAKPVSLARLEAVPFAGRLVAKFDLPVHSFKYRLGVQRR
ncbi:MAG: NAD kinase [Bowdeniella nasicola]|nr:NAD kinase [Bowdeniella nasicola]